MAVHINEAAVQLTKPLFLQSQMSSGESTRCHSRRCAYEDAWRSSETVRQADVDAIKAEGRERSIYCSGGSLMCRSDTLLANLTLHHASGSPHEDMLLAQLLTRPSPSIHGLAIPPTV